MRSPELSPAVDLAWTIAASEAHGAGHPEILRAHLLVGLLSLEKVLRSAEAGSELPPGAVASLRAERAALAEVLAGAALDANDLRRALRRGAGHGSGAGPGPISRSPAAKAAFGRALQAAAGGPVSALHLFAALLEPPDEATAEVLAERRVDVAKLAERARAFAGVAREERPGAEGAPPAAREVLAQLKAQVEEADEAGGPPPPPKPGRPPTPMLDRYARDLTRLAAAGELGPVVGRREELLQLLQTLARRSKNNPVLVGEAGVGKTAIVEALAIRAAAGKDQAVLGGKRIVELNLGALLGGTEYRGELEKRLTRILDEARADPDLIVFIDELHTVVGAGRVGPGGADAADLLKPALARGELTVIGATTVAEYRRHLESDPALERRFEKIDVREPSPEETREILWGLRRKWEAHHGVAIDDAALDAAVSLSVRFDADHRLPDKAVDLVDKACARVRVPALSMLGPSSTPGAAPAPGPALPVDARVVAEVLAEKRGLPLDLVLAQLGRGESARVLEVEGFLKQRLVGQDHAIERIAERLRVAHAGLADRRGALAVFLLLGPTGVGKTELARLLAEGLFGSAADLVRFDMSEYMEEHSVARLIGAPPGYVGHQEEGLLVRRLRDRPHAVVLLDEVEKAHPRIFDLFLQVFDEGRVTGAQGRETDARSAVFVLTSNLGGSGPKPRLGFADPQGTPAEQEDAERAALEEAKGFFRPELLNRIDEIVVFRPLGARELQAIARRAIERLAAAVRERHGVELRFGADLVSLVAGGGLDPAYGAREVLRAVERRIQSPLAQLALGGELGAHPAWRLAIQAGEVSAVPDTA